MCKNSETPQECPFLAAWFSTPGDIDDFIFADSDQCQADCNDHCNAK